MSLIRLFDRIFRYRANSIKTVGRSSLFRHPTSKILRSEIILNNSELTLGEGVVVNQCKIFLKDAKASVGAYSIVEGHPLVSIHIESGELEIDHHVRVRSNFLIRFHGKCSVGSYTAINEGTEIRCDLKVSIGAFNMISYGCQINDTNTHSRLPIEKRREMTVRHFPVIGLETDRPPSAPVSIGDDVWIGKGATILKGVTIGNSAVIGTQAVVVGNVPERATAVGNPARIIQSNEGDSHA